MPQNSSQKPSGCIIIISYYHLGSPQLVCQPQHLSHGSRLLIFPLKELKSKAGQDDGELHRGPGVCALNFNSIMVLNLVGGCAPPGWPRLESNKGKQL